MQTGFAGTNAAYKKWLAKVTSSHERRISFVIAPLSGAGEFVTLRPLMLDGEISVDSTRNPSRILDATFLDPTGSISFEPEDGETPIHRSKVLQVRWAIKVPLLSRWVTCRPFTGPIVDVDRDGPEVHLVAHGLDEQGLGEVVFGRTFPKKGSKAAALRWLAAKWGDKNLSVPASLGTFPAKFSVASTDQPWVRAQKIVRSVNRQMFYDGRGKLIIRRRPTSAVITLGPDVLLGPVSIDRNPEFKNRWVVIGAKPKGKKTPVRGAAQLPASNRLSPSALARDGEPLYHQDTEENSAYKTSAACKKRANERRDDSLRTLSEYSVECLPLPHLDEGDLVRIKDPYGTYLVRADQFTIPLGDSPMTIGAIKRARTKSVKKTRQRRLGGSGGSTWTKNRRSSS